MFYQKPWVALHVYFFHSFWGSPFVSLLILVCSECPVVNLIYCFTELARENRTISEDVLRRAFSATEDGFLTLVRRTCGIKPLMAAVGSCCLVGVIWKGTLYVANLGDSRAVIGSLGRFNKIIAEQLTKDHNASMEEVRQELRSRHPDDSHIVVMKHGVWRIKGIIQVCSYFLLLPSYMDFCLPQ
jgi:hypothetical protein